MWRTPAMKTHNDCMAQDIADPAILKKARTVDQLVGEDVSDQFPGESPQKSGVTPLLSTVMAPFTVSLIHMSKIKKSLRSDSLA